MQEKIIIMDKIKYQGTSPPIKKQKEVDRDLQRAAEVNDMYIDAIQAKLKILD